jgi:hypothetical protein
MLNPTILSNLLTVLLYFILLFCRTFLLLSSTSSYCTVELFLLLSWTSSYCAVEPFLLFSALFCWPASYCSPVLYCSVCSRVCPTVSSRGPQRDDFLCLLTCDYWLVTAVTGFVSVTAVSHYPSSLGRPFYNWAFNQARHNMINWTNVSGIMFAVWDKANIVQYFVIFWICFCWVVIWFVEWNVGKRRVCCMHCIWRTGSLQQISHIALFCCAFKCMWF